MLCLQVAVDASGSSKSGWLLDTMNCSAASLIMAVHTLLVVSQVAVDGSGRATSGWLLDTISVTAKSSGGISWFYAGRWLGAAAGLEAELEGSDGDVRGQLVTYKVGGAAATAAAA